MAFGPGAAVAIVVDPETQDPVVNAPLNPVSLAVNVWFAPEPVAVNDSDDGVSTIEAGTGVGVGVGVAVGVAVGVGVETSTP